MAALKRFFFTSIFGKMEISQTIMKLSQNMKIKWVLRSCFRNMELFLPSFTDNGPDLWSDYCLKKKKTLNSVGFKGHTLCAVVRMRRPWDSTVVGLSLGWGH